MDHQTLDTDERVIVLDDDPTGTQCAHDIDVVLDHYDTELATFAASDRRALYILTNTRALSPTETEQLIGRLRASVRARFGSSAFVILRGDSTLRGHIALEMSLLGLADGVGIVVPAYPAGGRTTTDGTHYVRTPDGVLPAAETEYARDPVFGYSSSRLADWLAESGVRGTTVPVSLSEVRDSGGEAVATALRDAPSGSVVIPDAYEDVDIAAIARGVRTAYSAGRHIVVRSAAPLAAVLAGTGERVVSPPAADRILVVCGSHTDGASRQLAALASPTRLLPTASRLLASADDVADELAELVCQLAADLDRQGVAVLASERVRSGEHNELHHGAAVMDALMRVATQAAASADLVVSKGGITSAETATRVLGATRAEVVGQATTGVPLWRIPGDGRHQVVVPGNVGDDELLRRIVQSLQTAAPSGS